MKCPIVLLALLLSFSCSTGPDRKNEWPDAAALASFEFFPDLGQPANLTEKKVWFFARLSGLMNQHRFRDPGNSPYIQSFILDPEPRYRHLDQLVAYNTGSTRFDEKSLKGRLLKVFGIIRYLEPEEASLDRKEAPGEYYIEVFWLELKD